MTHPAVQYDLPTGTLIDQRYKIVKLIGRGGFATVYEATQINIGRPVALKILHLRTTDKEEAALYKARFLREAQAAARIEHPYTVTVHDFGFISTDDGAPYIVMERLRGHNLREELNRQGAMTARRALKLTRQALEALAEAHKQGIVHKDLKPSNLFLTHPNTPRESLRVVDFGIAHIHHNKRLTQDGHLPGTPQYMAPDYLITHQATSQVDVYQMGLILIEMLTGQPVVNEPSALKCIMIHTRGLFDIPPALRSGPLGEPLAKALAFDPINRYSDADAFLEALQQIDDNATHVRHSLSGISVSTENLPRTRAAIGLMDTSDGDATPWEAQARGTFVERHLNRRPPTADDHHTVDDHAGTKDSDDHVFFGDEEPPPSSDEDSIFFDDEDEERAQPPKTDDEPAEDAPTPSSSPPHRDNERILIQPRRSSARDEPAPPKEASPQREGVFFFTPPSPRTVKTTPPQTASPPSPSTRRTQNAHSHDHTPRARFAVAVCLSVILGTAALLVVQSLSSGPRAPRQEATPDNYVLIEGGTFIMGSPDDEPGRGLIGETQHEVTLTVPFIMQRTEVTQAQWQHIMGANPSRLDKCGETCPVEGVGWWDALHFLNTLSERDKLTPCYKLRGCEGRLGIDLKCGVAQFVGLECDGYRLPTEAEWEFAARAQHRGARYGALKDVAWCDIEGRGTTTYPVGGKASNALGLHDMLGNVHEWVWDRHAEFTPESVIDPISIDAPVGERVYRGGSFDSEASACRAAYRGYDVPTYRVFDVGLRPVRSWLP